MTALLIPQLALAAGVIGSLAAGMRGAAAERNLKFLGVAALLAALAFLGFSATGQAGPLIRLDGLGLAWQFLLYAGALPFAFLRAVEDEVDAALFLGCVLGMGLLAASGNLLMLFIGLEFLSLPAYLLVARGRKASALEAGVKYFFAGGTAGALYLLGMALYYSVGRRLDFAPAGGPWAEMGLALMGAAALFKVGAVPLHFWLPDVYEAAAPELAGFFSTAVKSAGILLLMRVTALSPGSVLARSLPAVGALTMLVGALMALRQENLQRLLAYSSISHAGTMILGVGAWAALGARPGAAVSVLFYLGAYLFMSNGAFIFVKILGVPDRFRLRGYAKRRPLLAAAFAVLLLALAGIPPTAGFLAKLLVFWDAVQAGLYFPVALAGLAALISLAYYLSLIREMYFEDVLGPFERRPDLAEGAALAACAAPAALLGLAPWILNSLSGVLSR